jgi:hypothetical protein
MFHPLKCVTSSVSEAIELLLQIMLFLGTTAWLDSNDHAVFSDSATQVSSIQS